MYLSIDHWPAKHFNTGKCICQGGTTVTIQFPTLTAASTHCRRSLFIPRLLFLLLCADQYLKAFRFSFISDAYLMDGSKRRPYVALHGNHNTSGNQVSTLQLETWGQVTASTDTTPGNFEMTIQGTLSAANIAADGLSAAEASACTCSAAACVVTAHLCRCGRARVCLHPTRPSCSLTVTPTVTPTPRACLNLLADKYLLANSFGVWRYWRMAYGVART